ncbi:GNAT family N-acetyltransferase [Ruminococcus sp.]|uniref:GNAT family N-acetyltransferase n=1 Tax=Ruminococcus sp. TaxID=41978 RepID=UPI0025EF60D7|nr:GNAT family N-acetyltransferase [Ruminococcus sp.]MBQ8967984.1 GNAT family N-acetyltransferase [Ruminococcus sp.]
MNNISLVKCTCEDAELLHKLQREAFMPLYDRYRDDETSPALESIEAVTRKIADSEFYFICDGDVPIGGVRVRLFRNADENIYNISPIFILPDRCDKGLGTAVMEKLFAMYADADKWSLATIKQDERNCHFYEKLGFVPTGSSTVINERMTIVGYEKKV